SATVRADGGTGDESFARTVVPGLDSGIRYLVRRARDGTDAARGERAVLLRNRTRGKYAPALRALPAARTRAARRNDLGDRSRGYRGRGDRGPGGTRQTTPRYPVASATQRVCR